VLNAARYDTGRKNSLEKNLDLLSAADNFTPMNNTVTKEVFVLKVRDFLHEIARLNKKAARIGCAQITLVDNGKVNKTRTVVDVDDEGNENVRTYPVDVQHYTITLPDPENCAWSPIVKITPVENGGEKHASFAEPMPAGTQADADAWKAADPMNCDHCHTRRGRLISYVVRNKTDGRTLQLGRNCFEDYVGKDTLRALEFQAVIVSFFGGDDDFWPMERGGMRQIAIDKLMDVVATAEALCRIDGGWKNNVKDRRSGEIVENGTHRMAVHRLHSDVPETKKWIAENVTEADYSAAAAIIERMRDVVVPDDIKVDNSCPDCRSKNFSWQDGNNLFCHNCRAVYQHKGDGVSYDFERTLQNIAEYEWIPAKKATTAAYMGQYLRNVDRKAREAARKASLVYVGTVGQREVFQNLTVTRVHSWESQFGWQNMNVLEDVDGNVLVWKSGTCLQKGDKIAALIGTVVEHGEFNGTKQTKLSRCKELNETELAKALAKAAKAAAKAAKLALVA